MKKLNLRWFALFAALFLFFAGCSKDDETTNDNTSEEPQSVYYEPEIDNSFVDTLSIPGDTVEILSLTTASGDTIHDGDTVDTRVITIHGRVPNFVAKSTASAESTIYLNADGGSCMNPGPWDTSATFVIDSTQTVSVGYTHEGVMCTGDYGFTIRITEQTTGTVYWVRDLNQGTGMAIDTTYGTLTLPPGTYEFYVTTVTGTRTRARLTYTPGTGGAIGKIVVYENGNLYPVADAAPGAEFDYAVDLNRGTNTIRVLIVGNFDPAAQLDLANIFGASEVINVTCITEEIAIKAVLSWSIDYSDVDLHLVAPGGKLWTENDCYFANLNPDWGDPEQSLDNPMLDIDNVSGYGPETIVLPSPVDGLYTVVVHYWADYGGGDAPTTVAVTLNETDTRTFGPVVISDGQYWIVTGISVSGGIAEFASPPDSASLYDTTSSLARLPVKK